MEQILNNLEVEKGHVTRDQLNLEQCVASYNKLPVVPKKLYRGYKRRNALYYMNQKGKKVYLNQQQKDRLVNGRLPGVLQPIPERHQQPDMNIIPQAVFRTVDEQLAMARML